MAQWIVSEESSGISLQNFLRSKLAKEISAKAIKRFLDTGHCTLNGRIERFGTRLVGKGDKIVFHTPELNPLEKSSKQQFKILYADSDILVIDKPSGITSDDKCLQEYLQKEFGAIILLHRLDKETSGVLLFARNEAAARAVENQFKQRTIEKRYLALVDGIPKMQAGCIDNFLGKLKIYEGQTIWGEVTSQEGLKAVTYWNVLKAANMHALLQCYPKTGRTHQIRIHLSSIGHPILGDHQYGRNIISSYKPPRILLHASELSFMHPTKHERVTMSAFLPDDFSKAVKEILGSNG